MSSDLTQLKDNGYDYTNTNGAMWLHMNTLSKRPNQWSPESYSDRNIRRGEFHS